MVKRGGMAVKDPMQEAAERAYPYYTAAAAKWAAGLGQPLQTIHRFVGGNGPDRRRPLQDGEEDYNGMARQAGNADPDRIAAEWADLIGKAKRAQKGYRLKPALELHAFVTRLLVERL